MRLSVRSLIFVPAAVTLLALPVLIPGPAEAAWAQGFSYRSNLDVTNAPGVAGFQFTFTLNTASLVSSGLMRSDCGDLRVAGTDEVTMLPYWIETGCNTASTRVWFHASLPVGSSRVYLYHGNPSATSAAALQQVFDPVDFNGFKTGWKYSGTTGGRISGWEAPLTNFAHADSAWANVDISTDHVVPCDTCRWFDRREFFATSGTSVTYSGTVDDDEVWTIIPSTSAFFKAGNDANNNELDADGNNAHDFSHSFTIPAEGRFVWAGRGQEGGGGEQLVMSSMTASPQLRVRKLATPMPTVAVGPTQSETPVTTLSVAGTPGEAGWYVSPASVSMSCTSCASTWYKLNGGPLVRYTSTFTLGDGTHSLLYNSTGGVVEAQKSATIRVDTTEPVRTVGLIPESPNGVNGWYVGNPPLLNVTAADPTSGLASLTWALDQGAPQAYTSPVPLPKGLHELTVTAKNGAGLATTDRPSYAYDPDSPVSSAQFQARGAEHPYYTSDATISLTASDAASGVQSTSYLLDGGPVTTYTEPIAPPGLGPHTIRFWSADAAGNAEVEQTVSFELVSTDVALTLSDGDAYTRNSTIRAGLSPILGPFETRFTHNRGATWTPWVHVARDLEVTLAGANGGKAVSAQVRTVGGDFLGEASDTIVLARESAHLAFIRGTPGTNDWWRSPVRLSFDGNGSGEGFGYHPVAEFEASFDGGATFPETMRYLDEMEADSSGWVAIGANQAFAPADDLQGLGSLEFFWTGVVPGVTPSATKEFEGGYDLSGDDTIVLWLFHTREINGQDPGTVGETVSVRVLLDDATAFAGTIPSRTWTPVFLETIPPSLSSLRVEFPQGSDDNPLETERVRIDAVQAFNQTRLTEGREGRHVWQARVVASHPQAYVGFSEPETLLVDWTPPRTSVSLEGTGNRTNGWYNASVRVTLTANDSKANVNAVSGIGSTHYRLDSGPQLTYSGPFVVAAEGVHSVRWFAIDRAGNVEAEQTIGFRIDTTPPTLASTNASSSYRNGWFTDDVTLRMWANDTRSGVGEFEYDVNGTTTDVAFTGCFASRSTERVLVAEGVHTVRPRARDCANNTRVAPPMVVRIDLTPPFTTHTTRPGTPQGAAGWHNTSVRVTLAALDNLSRVGRTFYRINEGAPQNYTGEFEVFALGNVTVGYWSEDFAGNLETERTTSFLHDPFAPFSWIDVSPPEPTGSDGWYREGVSAWLNSTDWPSGLAEVSTGLVGGDVTQTPQACSTLDHVNRTDLAADGVWTLRINATDCAGNREEPVERTIRIDATPPVTTPVIVGDDCNEWFRSKVTIALNATDNSSGVRRTFFAIDGRPGIYTGPFEVQGEGNHTLLFWSEDIAGNLEEFRATTFRIDTLRPTTVITLDPPAPDGEERWYTVNVTVTIRGFDAMSGVARINWSVNGTTQSANASEVSFVLPADGVYRVESWATDHACLESPHDSATIRIDGTPPRANHTLLGLGGNRSWFRSNVAIVLEGDDNASGLPRDQVAGLREIRYSIDDGPERNYTGPDNSAGADGYHNVTYFPIDHAGNEGERRRVPFRIDRTPAWTGCRVTRNEGPADALDATVGPDLCTSGWYNAPNLPVQLAASDNASGVERVHWRWHNVKDAPPGFQIRNGRFVNFTVGLNRPNGDYVVEWSAEDMAGNREPTRSFLVRLDSVKPRLFQETPLNNTLSAPRRATVGIGFDDLDNPHNSGINLESVSLRVAYLEAAGQWAGSVNYTALSTRSGFRIDFTPSVEWNCGKHQATVSLADNAGNTNQKIWYFTVTGCPLVVMTTEVKPVASPDVPLGLVLVGFALAFAARTMDRPGERRAPKSGARRRGRQGLWGRAIGIRVFRARPVGPDPRTS